MKAEIAQLLHRVAMASELTESIGIMDDYGVRPGTEVWAVHGNPRALRIALGLAMQEICVEGGTRKWGFSPEELITAVAELHTDTLGYSNILWY
jgi:hypothetical protein